MAKKGFGENMKIHTVREGETLSEIAKEYGIDEDILRVNNEIREGECVAGEELLILTPTRTYTVKPGDSTERLALRFGVRRRDLLSMNPWICTEGLIPHKKVALSYGERRFGMAAAHGYFYNNCTLEALSRRLPYLTYVTVGSAVYEDDKIKRLFDCRDAVGVIRSADKIPLLRVYDREPYRKGGCAECEKFSESIISAALAGGYKGITLAGCFSEEYLVELRGKMIGCDLILFTELDKSSPFYLGEYSDGSVICYDIYPAQTYEAGSEYEFYKKFACDAESSKAFIELPAFASVEGGVIGRDEAVSMARYSSCEIKPVGESSLCAFTHKKRGKVTLPSLKSVKSTLDIIHEYGYMGISFDIMRCPLSYLMMYNSHFGTSTFTTVREVEGCSRARGNNAAPAESS